MAKKRVPISFDSPPSWMKGAGKGYRQIGNSGLYMDKVGGIYDKSSGKYNYTPAYATFPDMFDSPSNPAYWTTINTSARSNSGRVSGNSRGGHGGGTPSGSGSKRSSGRRSSGRSSSAKSSVNTAVSSITGAISNQRSNFDPNALYRTYMQNLQAAAQGAYNNNMGRIANAYNAQRSSLDKNFRSTRDQLAASRDASSRDITRDAEKSLKEAYINNMLSRKNLRQAMSAQGLNGGAAESTMGSLANNYGSSRNTIEDTRNQSLADLEREYNNNLAAAQQQYNTALGNLASARAQAEIQAEQAYQNMNASYQQNLSSLATSDTGYMRALQALAANQNNFEFAQTEATNDYAPVSAQQAVVGDGGTNYAKMLQQAEYMRGQGANANTIKNAMFQQSGGDVNTLAQVLQKLGLV